MDVVSPQAFWLIRNGLGDVPEALPANRRCDVLVIGAGITGALVADALTAEGLRVIAIDRRNPGVGSTSASTALLQYELDIHLADLITRVGRERAVAGYRACLEGVRAIARLANDLTERVHFRRRPSLYRASRSRDVRALREECKTRQHFGLPCEILGRQDLRALVDFDAPLALWNNVGGEVDPWRLTQALLSRCKQRDFSVYGRTDAKSIVTRKDGVEVRTNRGVIRARNVVVATGYEATRFLSRPVADLNSTYAMVTEPVKSFEGWPRRCLIWESAHPYSYARTTADNRIMIGGEDVPFRDASRRDALVSAKGATLLRKVRRLFPRIKMEVAYTWAGTFGETADGLPYIGTESHLTDRVFYTLGYGGNGIPFSVIAAELATAQVLGRPHRYQDTFSFDR
jgi:glycine/D-amino acid oxidase-like deaminating enzyme